MRPKMKKEINSFCAPGYEKHYADEEFLTREQNGYHCRSFPDEVTSNALRKKYYSDKKDNKTTDNNDIKF